MTRHLDNVGSFVGFCVSATLLVVCLSYSSSPQWHGTFHMFYSRNADTVSMPLGFRTAFLTFVVLNVPAVVLVEGVVVVIDPADPGNRMRLIYASLFLTSMVWWYAVSRIARVIRLRRGTQKRID